MNFNNNNNLTDNIQAAPIVATLAAAPINVLPVELALSPAQRAAANSKYSSALAFFRQFEKKEGEKTVLNLRGGATEGELEDAAREVQAKTELIPRPPGLEGTDAVEAKVQPPKVEGTFDLIGSWKEKAGSYEGRLIRGVSGVSNVLTEHPTHAVVPLSGALRSFMEYRPENGLPTVLEPATKQIRVILESCELSPEARDADAPRIHEGLDIPILFPGTNVPYKTLSECNLAPGYGSHLRTPRPGTGYVWDVTSMKDILGEFGARASEDHQVLTAYKARIASLSAYGDNHVGLLVFAMLKLYERQIAEMTGLTIMLEDIKGRADEVILAPGLAEGKKSVLHRVCAFTCSSGQKYHYIYPSHAPTVNQVAFWVYVLSACGKDYHWRYGTSTYQPVCSAYRWAPLDQMRVVALSATTTDMQLAEMHNVSYPLSQMSWHEMADHIADYVRYHGLGSQLTLAKQYALVLMGQVRTNWLSVLPTPRHVFDLALWTRTEPIAPLSGRELFHEDSPLAAIIASAILEVAVTTATAVVMADRADELRVVLRSGAGNRAVIQPLNTELSSGARGAYRAILGAYFGVDFEEFGIGCRNDLVSLATPAIQGRVPFLLFVLSMFGGPESNSLSKFHTFYRGLANQRPENLLNRYQMQGAQYYLEREVQGGMDVAWFLMNRQDYARESWRVSPVSKNGPQYMQKFPAPRLFYIEGVNFSRQFSGETAEFDDPFTEAKTETYQHQWVQGAQPAAAPSDLSHEVKRREIVAGILKSVVPTEKPPTMSAVEVVKSGFVGSEPQAGLAAGGEASPEPKNVEEFKQPDPDPVEALLDHITRLYTDSHTSRRTTPDPAVKYEVIKVPGDGNCGWYAIAASLKAIGTPHASQAAEKLENEFERVSTDALGTVWPKPAWPSTEALYLVCRRLGYDTTFINSLPESEDWITYTSADTTSPQLGQVFIYVKNPRTGHHFDGVRFTTSPPTFSKTVVQPGAVVAKSMTQTLRQPDPAIAAQPAPKAKKSPAKPPSGGKLAKDEGPTVLGLSGGAAERVLRDAPAEVLDAAKRGKLSYAAIESLLSTFVGATPSEAQWAKLTSKRYGLRCSSTVAAKRELVMLEGRLSHSSLRRAGQRATNAKLLDQLFPRGEDERIKKAPYTFGKLYSLAMVNQWLVHGTTEYDTFCDWVCRHAGSKNGWAVAVWLYWWVADLSPAAKVELSSSGYFVVSYASWHTHFSAHHDSLRQQWAQGVTRLTTQDVAKLTYLRDFVGRPHKDVDWDAEVLKRRENAPDPMRVLDILGVDRPINNSQLEDLIRGVLVPRNTAGTAKVLTLEEFYRTRAFWVVGGHYAHSKGSFADPKFVRLLKSMSDRPISSIGMTKKLVAEVVPWEEVVRILENQPIHVAKAHTKGNEHGKLRAIYGSSYVHYVIGSYLAYLFEEELGVDGAVGYEDAHAFLNRVGEISDECASGRQILCFDYQDFNAQHTGDAQRCAIRACCAISKRFGVVSDPMSRRAAEWYADSFLNQWFLRPDTREWVHTEGTLFSGVRLTSFLNKLLNRAYHQLFIENGKRLSFDIRPRMLRILGDDGIMSFDSAEVAVDYLTIASRTGAVASPAKQLLGKGRGEFLRLLYAEDGGVYGCLGRSIAGFVHGNVESTNVTVGTPKIFELWNQLATMARRGANVERLEALRCDAISYWALRNFPSPSAEVRASVMAYAEASVSAGGCGLGPFGPEVAVEEVGVPAGINQTLAMLEKKSGRADEVTRAIQRALVASGAVGGAKASREAIASLEKQFGVSLSRDMAKEATADLCATAVKSGLRGNQEEAREFTASGVEVAKPAPTGFGRLAGSTGKMARLRRVRSASAGYKSGSDSTSNSVARHEVAQAVAAGRRAGPLIAKCSLANHLYRYCTPPQRQTIVEQIARRYQVAPDIVRRLIERKNQATSEAGILSALVDRTDGGMIVPELVGTLTLIATARGVTLGVLRNSTVHGVLISNLKY